MASLLHSSQRKHLGSGRARTAGTGTSIDSSTGPGADSFTFTNIAARRLANTKVCPLACLQAPARKRLITLQSAELRQLHLHWDGVSLHPCAFQEFNLLCGSLCIGLQERVHASVSVGGHHQNTSLNTTDTHSPSWSDTLTFEHPSANHSELTIAVYAKHTLLPDTLVGSAGNTIC